MSSLSYRNDVIIDFIFATFDECFINNSFNIADNIIDYVSSDSHMSGLGATLTISILTATLSAKNNLRNRKRFFELSKKYLLETMKEKEVKELLRGLE